MIRDNSTANHLIQSPSFDLSTQFETLQAIISIDNNSVKHKLFMLIKKNRTNFACSPKIGSCYVYVRIFEDKNSAMDWKRLDYEGHMMQQQCIGPKPINILRLCAHLCVAWPFPLLHYIYSMSVFGVAHLELFPQQVMKHRKKFKRTAKTFLHTHTRSPPPISAAITHAWLRR